MKYIASCSFGKDSLAMILILIYEEFPLDEIIFYDTGKEFKAIYDIRDRMVPTFEKKRIKYTELHAKQSFDYFTYDHPVKSNKTGKIHKHGYGWCGARCRWGTTQKINTIEKHIGEGNVEYVGIAHDEIARLQKRRNGIKMMPLAGWGMTERDCLNYCYNRGFDWKEGEQKLYNILDRVSCWCCRNKNLKELKNIYQYLPQYWNQIKSMQQRIPEPYYINGKTIMSIYDLEKRFAREIDMKNRQYRLEI